ncbi:MAG: type 1 glutamine amidotransferase [Nitrospiraceae bacterium]|nr:type 1 glutamine amidotransferase [Nitrospiraceae bacterium]
MKVLILSDDGFEDLELFVPYYRFREEGFVIDVASKKTGEIEGKHDYGIMANKEYAEINPGDYDMLFLPGGKAPAKVRKDENALKIARDFMGKNKPVAAICHGPQILISAGVVSGRQMTCWPDVAKELKEAGALYRDDAVVTDGNLVTSRKPEDLADFMREALKLARTAVPA